MFEIEMPATPMKELSHCLRQDSTGFSSLVANRNDSTRSIVSIRDRSDFANQDADTISGQQESRGVRLPNCS
jgi:hypothetical protein